MVLVQRGREPNKGLWSLPGGKIELGETTIQAAQREIAEETGLVSLAWYEGGAFSVTDSIHTSQEDPDQVLFHYVITQCFAELTSSEPESALQAGDDAADAAWHSVEEIRDRVDKGETTPGVLLAVEKAMKLHRNGLLPCIVEKVE